ncbi:MAG: archease [Anaerolineaceae bacterium]|nr:archease [Anaerolineaceae bacterium]
MMIKNNESGYIELAHTADWALKIWAPDLAGLFIQAAQGMYALMQVELEEGPCLERTIQFAGGDVEDLLVSFLQELLYLAEMHAEGYSRFSVCVAEDHLTASLSGAPIRSQGKEIKAVTYHHLQINKSVHGLETVIVFDV